ncbi:MarR family transcriptional regulator [Myxococcaceae bacterium GXIMD 01537]
MKDMGNPKGERLERGDKQVPAQGRARRAAGPERAESQELAREAWSLLFELIRREMRHFPSIAAEFDLSPVQVHVLRALGESSLPMNSLAGDLGCDASNVTGLVDRLEGRGLVERQSATHDRRVKMLSLTEAGREVRERLMERLMVAPASISSLSEADLMALKEVVNRALAYMGPPAAESAPAQSSKKV